jgi:FkbM family methyltransferase
MSQMMRVISSPSSSTTVARNVALNGLADRVTIIPAAVGAEEGEGTLHLDGKNFGKHALADARPATGAATMAVPVTTLDVALSASKPLALIKIDVEGHEASVLAGAGAVLAHAVPLIVELTGFNYAPEAQSATLARLASHYATVVRLDREPWSVVVETVDGFEPDLDQHELLFY